MVKRRVQLSTRSFEKLGDARTFFADMLNRYALGDRVSSEDAIDLAALLRRHNDFDEKSGTGVVGFKVDKPPRDVPQFSKRCFWVIRSDGSEMDFSIGHCLQPQPYD